MFQKFSYKEIKKATKNFSTTIGQGGFGTVYKAHFSNGLVAAVKQMNKVSEQGEHEFCREIVLLARLHHRHLVSLRGFCTEKHKRLRTISFTGRREHHLLMTKVSTMRLLGEVSNCRACCIGNTTQS